MKRNNKKGFTIVELVIVIAVIAILSAVLIPTFGSVIADANEVARDEEAKNVYTTYITKTVQAGQDPVTEGYVRIETGKDTSNNPVYAYYILKDGNVDVEAAAVSSLPDKGTFTQVEGTDIWKHACASKTDGCGHCN